MKALLVARKTLLELVREWQLLLLVVAIPVAFLWITELGYGSPLLVTHPLLVAGGEGSKELLAEIAAEVYADGRPVFQLEPAAGPAAADEALKAQEATALLTVTSGQGVTIKGDALSMNFYRAGIILEEMLNRHDWQGLKDLLVQFPEQDVADLIPEIHEEKRLFILRPLQIGIRIFLTAGLFREIIDELRQDRGRLVDIHAGNAQHRFVEDTTLGFRVVGGDSGGAKGLLRDAFKTIQGGFQ